MGHRGLPRALVAPLVIALMLAAIPAAPAAAVNGDAQVLATVGVAPNVTGADVNKVTNRVYVISQGVSTTSPGTLTVISGADNSVVATLSVGNNPSDVVVNETTNKIYVVNNGSSTVSVVDGATNTVAGTIPSGNVIHGAVDPTRSRLYITTSSSLRVYDTNTNEQVASVAGDFYGVAVNTVTNRIYVGTFLTTTNVKVYDGANLAGGALATIPVTAAADIAVNETTGRVYVSGDRAVSVINGSTNTLLTTIPLATGASGTEGLSVDATRDRLYVAHESASKVAIIETITNAVLAQLPVGTFPQAAAVNTATDRVYVGNFSSNSVSVVGQPAADTTPPGITGVSDSNDPFSPDGDGVQDTTLIRWTLSEPAFVQLEIFDSAGASKRLLVSQQEAAGTHGVTWDGRIGVSPGPFTTAPAGTYTYEIRAADPANNRSTVRGTSTITQALPDLRPTSLQASPEVPAGCRASYRWIVTNEGTAAVPVITPTPGDQFYLSTTPSLAGQFAPAGGIVQPTALASGSSYTRTFQATIGASVAPGDYFLVLHVDSDAQIAESDESDNTLAVPIRIVAKAPGSFCISGTVHDAFEDLAPGVAVRISRADGGAVAATGVTDARGYYVLAVPDGHSYNVVFTPPEGSGFAVQVYNGQASTLSATPVVVSGADVLNIGGFLNEAFVASGRVVDQSGNPLRDVRVSAYLHLDPERPLACCYFIRDDVTDADGRYSIELAAGGRQYKMRAQGSEQWWNGFDNPSGDVATGWNAATPFAMEQTVTECTGEPVVVFNNTNFDAVVNGGTSPTFTTTADHCWIESWHYHWNGGSGTTAAVSIGLQGPTTLGPLPATPDVRRIDWFARPTGVAIMPAGTWSCTDSDQATWAKNAASGDRGFCRVTVRDVTQRTVFGRSDINFTLGETGGAITAIKRDDLDLDGAWDNGEPSIPAASLTLYRLDGAGQRVLPALASNTGQSSISLTGLAAGTYEVEEVPPAGYRPTGVHIEPGQHAVKVSNTVVRVTLLAGETSTFDFMNGRSGISGIATCDGASRAGANVKLYSGTTLIATTTADASGRYFFADVPAGTYTVVVNDGACGGAAVTVSETGAPTTVATAPPIDLNNHSWLTAYLLTLNSSATVQEHIFKQGQSTWFKFDVKPQSKVIVRLTDLATNYDLTLYKDIGQAFQSIVSQSDLDRLSIEFANELGANELGANELGANELGANELGANELGANELGANELGANELGAALSSAVTRSLIAFSSRGGTSDELIVRNTWNNTGRFYIRVRGRDGAFSLAQPFRLEVTHLAGSCGNVGAVTGTVGGSVVVNASALPPFKTVILTDLARMAGTSSLAGALAVPAVATLRDRLLTFASRPEVQGVVLDVGGDARVASANAQADANLLCPFAKNLVAQEIKRIVDGYRSPLAYLVIVGADSVIPFFRYPDKAVIANEDQYFPSVFESTSSQASLRLNYVLSDDGFASRLDVSRGDHTFPIADLAVGRLVETPAEATAVLDAYLATTNGVVPLTANALVTGYDFLEKDARAVTAELALGMARPVDELIHTRGTPLATAWNASQLAAALEQRRELVFLNGHMSQGSALAADYETRYLASRYAASAVDARNTIVMGVGCHLGYNTVDAHGLPSTLSPDWPQALARKGASLIASTGYAYGDSDIVDFGGRLFLEVARELRTGTGPVSIGTALRRAKQVYLASITRMSGTHEKQLLETTLFGLPHLGVNMPGTRLPTPAEPSIVGATTPLDATLGLSYADPAPISFGLSPRSVQLHDAATGAALSPAATYLVGGDGAVANPGEPILPLELRNVSASAPLRGVGFRSGTYVDTAGVRPLTSAPATEFRGVRSLFVSEFMYPVRPWSVNYFDAVLGGPTRLAITPAQFVSSAPGSATGTRREFSSMSFRLFYSTNIAAAALIAAPVVTGVTTTVLPGGSVRFDVTVSGEPTAGVHQAWITWTAASGGTQWASIDLARADPADFTRWTATVPGSTFGVSLADVRFIVQAVNGTGLVGLDTNHGRFHVPGAATATLAAPKASATLAFAPAAPTSGAYRSRLTLSAQLTSTGLVGSVPVTFSLGGQRAVALTSPSGLATATLRINEDPGDVVLTASVDETEQRLGASTAPVLFRVDKAPTSVALAPATSLGTYSDAISFVATLRRSTDNVPLDQQTVFFVVTPSCATPQCAGLAYETADITDLHGRARLLSVPLPDGDYTVRAFFLGAIPLSSGTYTITSGRYLASSSAATLDQSAESATVTYTGESIAPLGTALDLAATVAQDADGSLGDLALAQVRYEVKDAAGVIVTTPGGPAARTVGVSASGIAAPAVIDGLATGVYTIETSVVSGFFATAAPTTTLLAVFDPNGSTAGGGHIVTVADGTTVGLPIGEKANFAFQLRFREGDPGGHARFHIESRGGFRFRFEAISFEWLVTTFPEAQFQGTGTINGTGTFAFRVIVRDLGEGQSGAPAGQVDTYEIRIWDANAAVPTSFDDPKHRASGTLSGGNIRVPR